MNQESVTLCNQLSTGLATEISQRRPRRARLGVVSSKRKVPVQSTESTI
jgi:hypothetical protein